MKAVSIPEAAPQPPIHRWPFFSTPLRAFLAVMIPIVSLMGPLAALPGMPAAIRVTAGAVVAVSLYALWRGYLHRLEVDAEGVVYRTPLTRIRIPWLDVCRIGRYTPPDRNRMTQYVYVTRLDGPPTDRRVIDSDTLQLQDRPGLLEALEACRREHAANGWRAMNHPRVLP